MPRRPPPFDYTDALRQVIGDVVACLDEFRHVDLDRILLSASRALQVSSHGRYASCVPLRFKDGAREAVFRNRRYRMQPLQDGEGEILYILYFTLPRFHDEQDYAAKLATIIHELYHISPEFNGDIRRFPGRNYAHGHSLANFHRRMQQLAEQYRAVSPRAESHEFLRVPFRELQRRPGGVVGTVVPRPRLVRIATNEDPPRDGLARLVE